MLLVMGIIDVYLTFIKNKGFLTVLRKQNALKSQTRLSATGMILMNLIEL